MLNKGVNVCREAKKLACIVWDKEGGHYDSRQFSHMLTSNYQPLGHRPRCPSCQLAGQR